MAKHFLFPNIFLSLLAASLLSASPTLPFFPEAPEFAPAEAEEAPADNGEAVDGAEASAGSEENSSPQGHRKFEAQPVEINPATPPLLVGTTEPRGERASVFVVPITAAVDRTNLFILRRALKEAIRQDIEMVVLDMDTPGGRVDFTLEMMEMLDNFEGVTVTYVNNDAISAGSFIAVATDEIYFSPRGTIGASAVVTSGGEMSTEMRLKIESYLQAKIRTLAEDFRYRGDVLRAMMDKDFELVIDGVMIKPANSLLTLTAREAMQEFGDPPMPLLGSGIYESIEQLLEARWGEDRFEIREFEITYSERVAQWMATFAPGLLGIGLLLLFIEFRTPGFGFFGALGLALLAVFFISNYIAGLAGNEVAVIFALGVLLVLVELIFFPGIFVLLVPGALMMLGSLVWAMVDYWPGERFEFTFDLLLEPMVNLILGLGIATFGALLLSRFLPGSWVLKRMELAGDVGHGSGTTAAIGGTGSGALPDVGATGTAVRDMFPSGEVEINGQRYQASAESGSIRHGATVRVLKCRSFDLLVEEVRDT